MYVCCLFHFIFLLFLFFFIYCNSAIFLGAEHTLMRFTGFLKVFLFFFTFLSIVWNFTPLVQLKECLSCCFYCKRRGEADTVCSFNSIICWSNYEFNMYGAGAAVVVSLTCLRTSILCCALNGVEWTHVKPIAVSEKKKIDTWCSSEWVFACYLHRFNVPLARWVKVTFFLRFLNIVRRNSIYLVVKPWTNERRRKKQFNISFSFLFFSFFSCKWKLLFVSIRYVFPTPSSSFFANLH